MEYKVIPFPRLKTSAESLQANIRQYANHQYRDKLTPDKTACFGIGSQSDFVVHVDMVVFEKK